MKVGIYPFREMISQRHCVAVRITNQNETDSFSE